MRLFDINEQLRWLLALSKRILIFFKNAPDHTVCRRLVYFGIPA